MFLHHTIPAIQNSGKAQKIRCKNYGAKPKVQNITALMIFAPRKTPNHFKAAPLRWQFPKIRPLKRAKLGGSNWQNCL
jgi:hypothetical protein